MNASLVSTGESLDLLRRVLHFTYASLCSSRPAASHAFIMIRNQGSTKHRSPLACSALRAAVLLSPVFCFVTSDQHGRFWFSGCSDRPRVLTVRGCCVCIRRPSMRKTRNVRVGGKCAGPKPAECGLSFVCAPVVRRLLGADSHEVRGSSQVVPERLLGLGGKRGGEHLEDGKRAGSPRVSLSAQMRAV